MMIMMIDDDTYLSGTQVLHGAGQGSDVFLTDCDDDDDDRRRYLTCLVPRFCTVQGRVAMSP